MPSTDITHDAIPLGRTHAAEASAHGNQHVLCFAPALEDAYQQLVVPAVLQACGSYAFVSGPAHTLGFEEQLMPFLLARGYADVRARCEESGETGMGAPARELLSAPGFAYWEPSAPALRAAGLGGLVALLEGELPVTLFVDVQDLPAAMGAQLVAAVATAPHNVRVCVLARGVRSLEALCGPAWMELLDGCDHLLFLGAQRGSVLRALGIEGLDALEDGQVGVSWRERALELDEPLTAREHPQGAEAAEALRAYVERAEREAEAYIVAHPEG